MAVHNWYAEEQFHAEWQIQSAKAGFARRLISAGVQRQALMRSVFRAAAGVAILAWGTGWAQDGGIPNTSASGVPLDLSTAGALRPGSWIQFDQRQWILIKQMRAVFSANADPASVMLLQSLEPTGSNQPLNDVELLILQGGKAVYDYAKARIELHDDPDIRFYMDNDLEIMDVTHDGVPEVLFHSGSQGASDSQTIEHILRYDKTKFPLSTSPLHRSLIPERMDCDG